jgi:uncharacterized protein
MLHEFVSVFETPYVPFPTTPETIEVGGHSVHEYISPEKMEQIIENLSGQIDLHKFEGVLVNMNGGMFLFEQLSCLQGYRQEPVIIEYHRPKEAYGAIVVTPVPPELKGKRLLVLDDIYDSGGTLRAVIEDAGSSSQAVALVIKNGIPDQIKIPNILIGERIDNKWIGGCGMDMGLAKEGDCFRCHPGLAVKISDLNSS